MNEHPQIRTLEYDAIADGISIGTNQCCQRHFDEKLKREGIEADISLEEERVDAPFGVQFYVWIPVKNHAAPTHDQLAFGVSHLEDAQRQALEEYAQHLPRRTNVTSSEA